MFFNNGFWFYSMMGGWSTWQWVVLDSSQFFWSFDTPETPGSVSVVFADNWSENEIWNRLKQFLPVCTRIHKIPLCILLLWNLSHMKHFSCILLEIFAIKFVITYLFIKLHCALKSEEPFPISFNPPTTIPQSLQKLPPCLTLLCPILIFRRCPIKFRLKILMSNHPGRSSVGHSLNLQEPHQNNGDKLFSDEDYGIIKGLIKLHIKANSILSSLSSCKLLYFCISQSSIN